MWKSSEELHRDERDLKIVREHLAHIRIESVRVEHIVLDHVKQLRKLAKKEGAEKKLVHMNKSIIAYGMYSGLYAEKCPREMELIASLFDLLPKHLTQVEILTRLTPEYHSPATFVERIIDCLALPYWLGAFVSKVLEGFPRFDTFKQSHVVGVVIVKLAAIVRDKKLQEEYASLREHHKRAEDISMLYAIMSRASEWKWPSNEKPTVAYVAKKLNLNPTSMYIVSKKFSIRKIALFLRRHSQHEHVFY